MNRRINLITVLLGVIVLAALAGCLRIGLPILPLLKGFSSGA